MGVNSTSCPVTTGSATLAPYPLVANLTNGAMVLWDSSSADVVRTIIGLSQFGGIAIAAGDNPTNGSAILLSAQDASYSPGAVVTLSNGDGTSTGTQIAFNHINYDPLTSPSSLLTITGNGNARIGNYGAIAGMPTTTDRLTVDGNIYINSTDNSDATYRNIFAKSATSGLNVTSGKKTDGSDGACFNAYAWNVTPGTYPAGPYPGAFIINSNESGPKERLGFGYINYTGPAGGGPGGTWHNIFLAGKQGQGCFGADMNLTDIVNADVFTIKNSLGFYAIADANPRVIHGETNAGNLSISSYIDYTTGSNITMYGITNANPSELQFSSVGTDSTNSILATFDNYNGSILQNNVQIGNNGQTVVGKALNLGMAVNNDVLTVKQSLGFYSVSDADPRVIHGETNAGSLSISSYTDYTNSASIKLYGSSSSNPYELQFSSVSTGSLSPTLATFDNFDGSVMHSDVQIGNNGQTVIGKDLGLATAVSGDVLTVKNQIGMYSSPDAEYARTIHGNSNTGGLTIYSTTNVGDGSGIELWAPNSPHYPGQVHLISNSDGSTTGPAFVFLNGTPTYVNYMQINKDGRVVIAGPGNSVEDITTPGTYGLYVGGGLLTEHVKVAVYTTSYWADYVFNKNYKLMPLSKVADYINENKHLPGIPSADDVVNDGGIDLGNMDTKLLQKVEELTLYVIQQQKQIDELKEGLKNRAK